MFHNATDKLLEDYASDDVRALLHTVDLDEYFPLITNKKITGRLISVCYCEEDFLLIGINNILHARVLIKELRSRHLITGC